MQLHDWSGGDECARRRERERKEEREDGEDEKQVERGVQGVESILVCFSLIFHKRHYHAERVIMLRESTGDTRSRRAFSNK